MASHVFSAGECKWCGAGQTAVQDAMLPAFCVTSDPARRALTERMDAATDEMAMHQRSAVRLRSQTEALDARSLHLAEEVEALLAALTALGKPHSARMASHGV